MAKRPRRQPRRYLEETAQLRVRFQEVDSMRVVWHGHYVTYLEEGRRALGRRFGIDYPVFLQNGVLAPLVKVHLEHLAPARESDILLVTARLYESEGAKLEFEYAVAREADGRLLARGSTVQAFTTLEGELLLTRPPFLVELCRSWEPHWLGPA